jgi:N-acetylmuramoyl-L-alanine amidase
MTMGGDILFKQRKFFMFFLCLLCIFTAFSIKVSAAEVERFGGNDRYETAVKVSQDGWQSSDYVIIVSGEDFPDALCSAPLAKKYNAPILLTDHNSLSDSVIKEIKRLGAKNAIIVGGIGAVTKNIENQLNSLSITFTRIQGTDRFDTSVKIAQLLGVNNGVVIASGANFPDALSIAPIAAAKQMPILLTNATAMPSNVKSYLKSSNANQYYVVGGTGVISNLALSDLNNYKRLGGADRYQTNTAVINEFFDKVNFDNVYLATGENFADAIGGAAAAAKTDSPIVLTNSVNNNAQAVVQTNIGSISSFKILGGIAVLPDVIVQKIINGGPIKIALDAGHGGYDSGAVGPTGLFEKNVTLAITLKVGQILQQKGIGVVYTRTSDKVIWPADVLKDLQTRCDIANNAKVKYFVCIHANSFDNPDTGGTETYYTDGNAESQKLAQSIQQSLVSSNGLYNRGIKTAGYYVLKHINAPSILTEVAFISNPKEESLLADDSFQTKSAQGIANGILNALGYK